MRPEGAVNALACALAAALVVSAVSGSSAAPRTDASGPEPPDAAPEPPGRAPAAAQAPSAVPPRATAPVRISVGAIGASARIVPVGLDADGALEVPPLEDTGTAGWYRLGAAPGEKGPAVIVGHRDTASGPSVFFRLEELESGDTVRIGRADGSTAVFRVRRTERAAKARFPSAKVYGPVDHAALRLITCAGPFDSAGARYRRNLIVYARLVPD
ncbi:class F sortase [Streptomonospora arabica]|uniref:Class F sortase n=1 Tax=Streptomonospora arabica TaxID=412417 RepID=A0ABV9SLB9_9ACTN